MVHDSVPEHLRSLPSEQIALPDGASAIWEDSVHAPSPITVVAKISTRMFFMVLPVEAGSALKIQNSVHMILSVHMGLEDWQEQA